MKIKNVKLEWYAFRYDWNNHKLEFINVLNVFKEDIAKKRISDFYNSDDREQNLNNSRKLLEEVFKMTLVEAVIKSGDEEIVHANRKIALTDIESKD